MMIFKTQTLQATFLAASKEYYYIKVVIINYEIQTKPPTKLDGS